MRFLHSRKHTARSRVAWFSRLTWSVRIAVIFVLLLVLLQAERFITQGTLLGYQIVNRDKPSQVVTPVSAGSARACKAVTTQDLANAIGEEVSSPTQTIPDITTPDVISTCTFQTARSRRSVTIVMRQYADASEAVQLMERVSKRAGASTLDIANGASFSESARQLVVRKDGWVLTITVSQPKQGAVSSEQAAVTIVEYILKTL